MESTPEGRVACIKHEPDGETIRLENLKALKLAKDNKKDSKKPVFFSIETISPD